MDGADGALGKKESTRDGDVQKFKMAMVLSIKGERWGITAFPPF